ncbi:MAG: methyltransferase domain-containing protein [Actinobacteria bacterium]|nr:methyltransferase domain-containing protein [Actinomycetota bacterium]
MPTWWSARTPRRAASKAAGRVPLRPRPGPGADRLRRGDRGAPARVLEVGCGPGELAARIATTGAAVAAVDISPRMVELAAGGSSPGRNRRRHLHDLRVLCGQAEPVVFVATKVSCRVRRRPRSALDVGAGLRVGARMPGTSPCRAWSGARTGGGCR